jgi:hypothetical protein
VKPLASLVAVGCAVAAAVVAGPALSAGPWRPEPVNFELRAPGGVAAASAGGLLSRPLRAPGRFNLVGMRWRGRAEPGIAIRTRKLDGRWSSWAPLSAHGEDGPDPGSNEPALGTSSPLWVGEADEVQYRLTRRVPGLRLHFVNVEGTATAADRARTALRRAANAAVSSVAGVLGASAASAQEPQPAIVPRAGWGAEDCPPRTAPAYGEVKAAFVHHTVSANDYPPEEAAGIVLAICRYHRNNNGWNDIGYNFLVDKYGVLYEGRAGGIDQAVMGAQAQGYNSQTTGIANIGDHRSVAQTPEALGAIARLIRWKLPLHGVPTSGEATLTSAGGSTNRYGAGAQVYVQRVLGHRDTNSTACPGDALYAQLPELRALVGNAGPAGTATALSATLNPRAVGYRGNVSVSGRLSRADGSALPSEALSIEVFRGGRWTAIRNLVTAPDGGFSTSLRPRITRFLRARFPGRADLLPSASPRRLLAVRPIVRLTRPPTRGVRGRRVRIRGTVAPAKRRLFLVLQQRRAGRFRTVGVKAVRVRRGRFSTSFIPAGNGAYRFHLVARADAVTVRARSTRQLVAIGR